MAGGNSMVVGVRAAVQECSNGHWRSISEAPSFRSSKGWLQQEPSTSEARNWSLSGVDFTAFNIDDSTFSRDQESS